MIKKDYQKLKEVIYKANPEKMKQFSSRIISGEEYDRNYELIRLEDILKAIEENIYTPEELAKVENDNKNYKEWRESCFLVLGVWNLKDDNLDNQSDETKQFLTDLLTKP